MNLAYDGTDFRGWQLQPDVRTVQGELEEVLTRLFPGERRRVIVAGRTDTGVHALGQVVHVDLPEEMDVEEIHQAVNALLPEDIVAWRTRRVHNHFHARFWAKERTYGYRLLESRDIFLRRYGWHPEIDFIPERIESLTGLFRGRHNFRAFATKPDKDIDFECEVKQVRFTRISGGRLLRITADRFLRKMVRTIVGTLVEAGAGRFDRGDIQRMLAGEAERTGVPAPPNGLALLQVRYDSDDSEDDPELSLWGETA